MTLPLIKRTLPPVSGKRQKPGKEINDKREPIFPPGTASDAGEYFFR